MPKLNSFELKMKAKMEEKIAILEGMTVTGAIRILKGRDEKRKFQLIKDLAGKILGRKIDLRGQLDGVNPVTVTVNFERAKIEQPEHNLQAPRFAIPSVQ